MNAEQPIAVSTAGLSVTLGPRPVLAGIDFAMARGEVVGLLGPNGAGKSTLIRALAGQVAFDGSIAIEGRDQHDLTADARSRIVAHLPQGRMIAWPLAVETVVGLGRLPWRGFAGRGDADGARACREAMELADVTHLAGRPATALSGGEQARVLAARAIAQATPVLLADEPVAGLDPAHQMSLMLAFRRIAARGRAVLVSLHDLTLAARWCDRVVVLHDGRIAADGAPASVLTADLLERVFDILVRLDHDECGPILTPIGLSADRE
ncbi:MAG: ABC transporter ATP-binding protein [Rhizobiaceae bacterium]|nr:ABC transporter ATP-binding protein [Rhizobiaceae bacterium]MCV0404820.1 ABC transporter ATP-binding protein [Rhizobiaceae bacterium]